MAGLQDEVDGLPLVDHHCHGVLVADPDDDRFDAMLTEGGPAPGQTNFDTPVGLSVRRLVRAAARPRAARRAVGLPALGGVSSAPPR